MEAAGGEDSPHSPELSLTSQSPAYPTVPTLAYISAGRAKHKAEVGTITGLFAVPSLTLASRVVLLFSMSNTLFVKRD